MNWEDTDQKCRIEWTRLFLESWKKMDIEQRLSIERDFRQAREINKIQKEKITMS